MAINLDARAAALLVQNANKYQCRLMIRHGSREFNCKSMMGLVSMAIYEGQEVTVSGTGAAEAEAVENLTKMLAHV
jgi:phosphotransferase system HPr (HPr) family protein